MKERSRRISLSLGAALFAGLWVAACDLNPQPLPPGFSGNAPGNTARDDASTSANEDSGAFGGNPADAGAVPPAADAGHAAGDAAAEDGGPVTDASADAPKSDDAGDGGGAGDAADAAGDAGQGDE